MRTSILIASATWPSSPDFRHASGTRIGSRAHASVLLDVGRLPEAFRLLRWLHAGDPADAFVALRLVDALQRRGAAAAVATVLHDLDFAGLVGDPEHIMTLAHHVLREKDFEKAYVGAYELVRRHPNNPNVALAHAGIAQRFCPL